MFILSYIYSGKVLKISPAGSIIKKYKKIKSNNMVCEIVTSNRRKEKMLCGLISWSTLKDVLQCILKNSWVIGFIYFQIQTTLVL